jgi:hypothetical protein
MLLSESLLLFHFDFAVEVFVGDHCLRLFNLSCQSGHFFFKELAIELNSFFLFLCTIESHLQLLDLLLS